MMTGHQVHEVVGSIIQDIDLVGGKAVLPDQKLMDAVRRLAEVPAQSRQQVLQDLVAYAAYLMQERPKDTVDAVAQLLVLAETLMGGDSRKVQEAFEKAGAQNAARKLGVPVHNKPVPLGKANAPGSLFSLMADKASKK